MEYIKPLKRFGQNFLQDKNILRKIVDEFNPRADDLIIEIGPGHGALTEKILERKSDLIAIEIDKRVIENLSLRFPNLNLVQEDFLDLDLNKYSDSNKDKIRIIGNIPYNLTSPILFKLFENNIIIEDAVFMVQLEVAKRMTADIGSKDYGILSVLLSYFGKAKLVFKVSPNVFYPKPKVQSAIVHIYFDASRVNKSINSLLIAIVKASFGNRRKTLKNSLSNSIFARVDFSKCDVDLSLRAEQLNIYNFIELTNFVDKYNSVSS
jgi:16S rRNA (adenine1518-N6/adenine1519-N6)-dimethyltransferase